jgi:hypothetical protein
MASKFFRIAGKEFKASLTTGSKLNRAQAGLGDVSLALGIAGLLTIWIPWSRCQSDRGKCRCRDGFIWD